MWSIPGVIESNICLLPMITKQSRFFLELHTLFKNNVYWIGSGQADQPNAYNEAMKIITNRIAVNGD